MNPFILHFDGACEPFNPGGTATYGWTVHNPDSVLLESGYGVVCSGKGATNNVAEYAALEMALQYLQSREMRVPLLCRGDSRLVVETVAGRWKGRKPHIIAATGRCSRLLEQVGSPGEMEWIPRRENEECDELSKKAYYEATGKKVPERYITCPHCYHSFVPRGYK